MTSRFENNCLELLAAAYRERGRVLRQKELALLTHIPQQDISDILLSNENHGAGGRVSDRNYGPNDSHLARTAWAFGFRYKIVHKGGHPAISVYEQVLGQHQDEPVLNDQWQGVRV
jgi:hypothetical protein